MLSPITRPKLLFTFLKRSMSMNEHGGAVGLAFARAGDGALQAIHEQLAVGQAGQAVMHRVVDQPLMRALQIGDVAHQAGAAQQPGVLARRGMRPEVVPKIGAVLAPQAEIDLEVAALLLLERPQHQPEPLAVGGVHILQEIVDGDVERAGLEPKLLLHFVGHGDLVAAGVPLEDVSAGAVHRQRLQVNEARRTRSSRERRPSGRRIASR